MGAIHDKLEALVRQAAAAAGVELYHWELHQSGRGGMLHVQIDRPEGVTLDDCARTSRILEGLLDSADPIPGSYVLEVSSPGVERGLWSASHYAQAVGKTIQVLARPEGAHQGRLVQATQHEITLDEGGRVHVIPLAHVVRARVRYEEGTHEHRIPGSH